MSEEGGDLSTDGDVVDRVRHGALAEPRSRLVLPHELHVVDKPWGREVWWALTSRYCGKRIEVRAGHALSLQYHRRKHEVLFFVAGRVRLTLGPSVQDVPVGSAAVVAPGTVHRIEALTDAVIFEVSTPEVDDVVRLEDRYGRGLGLSP